MPPKTRDPSGAQNMTQSTENKEETSSSGDSAPTPSSAPPSVPPTGPAPAPTRSHTFVVHVEDIPGVLNRVSSLFRRRNYNIDSLTVSRTHQEGVSRMTVVVQADDDKAKRIEANLYKLVNVLRVDNISDEPAVVRDLALIKVRATPEQRSQILTVCEVFRARVLDVSPRSVVVEMSGTREKINGLLDVLEPFGLVELVQSGVIGMARGADHTGASLPPTRKSIHVA